MRKFFTILAVIATLFCLSSCMKDKEQNYVFTYEVRGGIQDETQIENVKKYFSEHYTEKVVSYYATHFDAMEKAVAQFEQDMNNADHDTILAFLEYEEDFIELYGVLSATKTREWVGTQTWTYQDKVAREESLIE
ncbi:MAG: hypothetical protein J6Y27_06995 [Bacteroidales bacterium]|nr:hypothetical protein [Bacteroidales bacterium]MBP5390074.1 hypothetical protein [Bacteroidales bacterium]